MYKWYDKMGLVTILRGDLACVPPTEAPPPPPTEPPAAPPVGRGPLTITNVNKGDEWAEIRNDGAAPVDLGGWVLRSEKGSQDCALGGQIQPAEVLRIWAMTGSPGYSCGFGSNIWNNSEPDNGVLLNPQGQEVSRYNS